MQTNVGPTARSQSAARWPFLAVVVFIVASCSADPGASSPPGSASPIQSSTPASPARQSSQVPAGSNDPQPAPTDAVGIVQVVADGLQLRSAAGTGASVVGGLERGAIARIESDPVESDGYVWYEVVDLDGNRGWAASGDDEDAWLAILSDQPEASTVLRFEEFGHVSPPASMPSVTVLDDLRVVFGGFEDGWRLGRLTHAGFARLSESVLESPYLQASVEYVPIRRANVDEGPAHGAGAYRFTIRTAAEPIVVMAVQWFGEEEEAAFWEPSPERRALDGIARGLRTLEEALGADAWAADPIPYVGGSFIVWIGPGEGPEPPDVSRVDPAALSRIESFGDLGDLPRGGECVELTVDDAFELARLVREGGNDFALHTFASASLAADDRWFGLSLSPRAPDGFPGCDDFEV